MIAKVTLLACLIGLACSSGIANTALGSAYSGFGYPGYGDYAGYDIGHGPFSNAYGAHGNGYGANGNAYGAYGNGYGAYGKDYGTYSNSYGANGNGYGVHGNGYSAYGNRAGYSSLHPGGASSCVNIVKVITPKTGYNNALYGAAGLPYSGAGLNGLPYSGAAAAWSSNGAAGNPNPDVYGGYRGNANDYSTYGNNGW